MVMWDFLLTTTGVDEEGRLTRAVSGAAARALRWIDRDGDGRLRGLEGPLILGTLVAVWFLSLWLGWALVIASGAAFEGPDGETADLPDLVAFVGSTLSTMGLGVLTPRSAAWHAVAVGASVTGMVMLTLSIAYVINVTSVAAASRAYAWRMDLLRHAAAPLAPQEARDLVLREQTLLVESGTKLAACRQSVPLTVLYDREGTRLDVRRAARDFDDMLGRLDPPEGGAVAARLSVLRDVLDGICRSRAGGRAAVEAAPAATSDGQGMGRDTPDRR